MIVVIMAGGKGTRIASVNAEVPKPMLQVGGKPVLVRQIEMLQKQGVTEIILVTGYLHKIIENYFGTDGSYCCGESGKKNVNIRYVIEDEPLGTAGSLFFLKDLIDEDFLLMEILSLISIYYDFRKRITETEDWLLFIRILISTRGIAVLL